MALVCNAPRTQAATIYVRVTGNDANDGVSRVAAVRTIREAATRAKAGDRIVVGPGTYTEGNITLPDAAFARVDFAADRRGTQSGDPPGDVVIDATNFTSGFELNNKLMITIDGFVIYGAGNGIYVKSRSDQVVIRNNIVCNNSDNGVYIQDSKNATVFNNLIYNNRNGSGILLTGSVSGSPGARIINNTIYQNGNRGIFFAGTTIGSPNAMLLNNAVDQNGIAGIQVNPTSRDGYLSAGNVSGDRYASGTPVDVTDVHDDPLLVDPPGADGVLGGHGYADDDFHLSQTAAGQTQTSPAVDAGSDSARLLKLGRASTRTDGRPDGRWVDAGYHYNNFNVSPTRPQARLRYKPLYVSATSGADDNDGARAATPLLTVGRALRLAQPGNRILLMGGTYHEGLLRPPNSGTPGREIVIEGMGGAAIDATGSDRGILIVGRSYVTVVDLIVTGASDSGIEIRDLSNNITVRRCRLYQNGRRGLNIDSASAITVDGDVSETNGSAGIQVTSGMADITRSVLRGNLEHGLWALGGSSVSVTDSQLTDNHKNGMQADQSTATLTNVTLSGNAQTGFRQSGGTAQILHCSAGQNGQKGLSVDGADQFVVGDAQITANGENGIQVATTKLASIGDSVITANTSDGVTVLDSSAPQIWNNLIYLNRSSGILISGVVSGSPKAQVLNNTLFGNQNRGVLIGGSNDQPPSPSAVVLRNIFQGNGTAGLQVNQLSLQPGYVIDYNLSADPYGALTPVGDHDILADPMLVQPSAGDFHLKQRSAGQNVTSLAVDAGSIDVATAGMQGKTTRTDGVADSGPVDLGYHYQP